MNCMTPISMVIVALATWQIIEIWHHGSIFASVRARLEVSSGWLTELLLCPFCMSPWVALICIGMMQIYLIEFIPLIFALSRLANLCNDVFYRFTRTPRISNTISTTPLNGVYDWKAEQRAIAEEQALVQQAYEATSSDWDFNSANEKGSHEQR